MNSSEWQTIEEGVVATYLLSKSTPDFLGHSFGHAHCCHSTGLSAANLAPAGVAGLCLVLGHLGGLARPCFANDHQHLVVGNSIYDLLLESVDGQTLPLLFDAAAVLDAIGWSLQVSTSCSANFQHNVGFNCSYACMLTMRQTSRLSHISYSQPDHHHNMTQ